MLYARPISLHRPYCTRFVDNPPTGSAVTKHRCPWEQWESIGIALEILQRRYNFILDVQVIKGIQNPSDILSRNFDLPLPFTSPTHSIQNLTPIDIILSR